MKYILYSSHSKRIFNEQFMPRGLFNIYNQAKLNNQKHSITGFLTYKKGHYLQLIEGSNEGVDRLFENIKRDDRHKDIVVIAQGQIDLRAFQNWRFDLALSSGHHNDVQDFFAMHQTRFDNLDADKRALLDDFFPKGLNIAKHKPSFAGQSLALKQWPKLHRIGQTYEVLKLCSQLLNSPQRYEDLLAQNIVESQSELDRLLDAFDQQKVLQLSGLPIQVSDAGATKKGDRFYQRMRSFLRLS